VSAPTTCHILAPAKINLGLRVLGKRPDGFHEIRTTFVALDLYDRLTFTKKISGGVRLDWDPTPVVERERLDFPLDERNLIVRAIRLLEERAGHGFDVAISVHKRIPTAAGLGGGSSDAAAALVGIDRLYGLGLSPHELAECAARLGSDVPFFLGGPAAVGEGRGERLRPVALYREWWAILVSPPVALRAADVYGRLRLTSPSGPSSLDFREDGDGFFSALRQCRNDLEAVVTSRFPELLRWEDSLREAGAESTFVTGSGPTVVGVFRRQPGDLTVERIRARDERVRVILARPVTTKAALVVE